MAYHVSWSPKALSNLEDISNYIAKDSEFYAKLFVQKIVCLIRQLTVFPKLGRIVPEYKREDLREIIYHDYRIVYRIKETLIEIVVITHGAKILHI